jgi:hypothetical protein
MAILRFPWAGVVRPYRKGTVMCSIASSSRATVSGDGRCFAAAPTGADRLEGFADSGGVTADAGGAVEGEVP